MRGKVTFRHGRHTSRTAYWADQITLATAAVERLEKALGRKIEADELERIESELATASAFRERWKVSQQDVKESLQAIAKLDPTDALTAMKLADSTTRALLKTAARYGCGHVLPGSYPPRELIPRAASIALVNLSTREHAGGRPINGHQRALAQLALDTWIAFGQTDTTLWYSADNPDTRTDVSQRKQYRSPLMEWAGVLFVAAGEKDNDTQLKKLLEAVIKGGGS